MKCGELFDKNIFQTVRSKSIFIIFNNIFGWMVAVIDAYGQTMDRSVSLGKNLWWNTRESLHWLTID